MNTDVNTPVSTVVNTNMYLGTFPEAEKYIMAGDVKVITDAKNDYGNWSC